MHQKAAAGCSRICKGFSISAPDLYVNLNLLVFDLKILDFDLVQSNLDKSLFKMVTLSYFLPFRNENNDQNTKKSLKIGNPEIFNSLDATKIS